MTHDSPETVLPRSLRVREMAEVISTILRAQIAHVDGVVVQQPLSLDALQDEVVSKLRIHPTEKPSFIRAVRELLGSGEIEYDIHLQLKHLPPPTPPKPEQLRYTRAFPDRDDHNRKEAARDRARIIQSPEFIRLAGTTQVVSPNELAMFHNRMSHSLLVAETAKRFAERLKKDYANDHHISGLLETQVDSDVVESAGLAHDLGHPPFGHAGEAELEACYRDFTSSVDKTKGAKTASGVGPWTGIGGFEGNAQSFRIITRLAARTRQHDVSTRDSTLSKVPEALQDQPHGLNLTRATLNAVAKYPWTRATETEDPFRHRKWNVYDDDQPYFEFAQGAAPPQPPTRIPTIEAQIMDWADDIAYSIHDLTDFYRVGLIPLDAIVTNETVYQSLCDDFAESKLASDKLVYSTQFARSRQSEIYENLLQVMPLLNVKQTPATYGEFHQYAQVLTSRYLKKEMTKLQLDGSGPDERLRLIPEQEIEFEVEFIKYLTRHYVIEHPSLAHIRAGQKRLVRELFEYFYDSVFNLKLDSLPPKVIEWIEFHYNDLGVVEVTEHKAARIVCDFISGLTELQVSTLHERLYQGKGRSVLDPIVR